MEKLCGDDFVLEESQDFQKFGQGPNVGLNPSKRINLKEYSQLVGLIQLQHLEVINLFSSPTHKTPIKGNRPPTNDAKKTLENT